MLPRRAYADVAVRMLGDHGQAYDGRIRPDGDSLARALAVLVDLGSCARIPDVVGDRRAALALVRAGKE